MNQPSKHRLQWLDAGIACALLGTTVLLLATTADMGFTRDESFYFKYSNVYQDWFSRVADDSEEALGRHDVVQTWRQNFEHPPLMKVLFGTSWRVLAQKKRPVRAFETTANGEEGVEALITNLTEADGFQEGESVQILGPHRVDDPTGEDISLLATARVTDRSPNRATVHIEGVPVSDLVEACKESTAPNKPPAWITGCRAATDGPLQIMRESSAMRAPTWVMTGLLIMLLYLFGTELFGRWAGLFAALAFLFIPRQFFHAHLCTFDVPVTTTAIATLYGFWKSLSSRWWAIGTGFLWGIALLCKLNAFFLPIPLLFAWLFPPAVAWLREHSFGVNMLRGNLREFLFIGLATLLGFFWGGLVAGACFALLSATACRWQLRLPPLPEAFLWMPPIGLIMLFTLWPRLWYDPAGAFYDYVNFHIQHVHYLQQYYGNVLEVPPFPVSYPFVMTAVTVPVPLLAIFGLGAATLFVGERKRTSLYLKVFIAANLLFPIALIALPNTPIFGGVKHWFISMAFFALIAGYGFDWLRRRTIAAWEGAAPVRAFTTTLLCGLILSSGLVSSLRYVNAGTSYYNELIGGSRGAATLGMQRQFWGYAGGYALDYINRTAPRNATVAFHNTTWDAHEWYKRDGLLRSDIRWRREPPENCQRGAFAYLFHHQESFAQDEIEAWRRMRTYTPSKVIEVDGVPILTVYRCGGEDDST